MMETAKTVVPRDDVERKTLKWINGIRTGMLDLPALDGLVPGSVGNCEACVIAMSLVTGYPGLPEVSVEPSVEPWEDSHKDSVLRLPQTERTYVLPRFANDLALDFDGGERPWLTEEFYDYEAGGLLEGEKDVKDLKDQKDERGGEAGER